MARAYGRDAWPTLGDALSLANRRHVKAAASTARWMTPTSALSVLLSIAAVLAALTSLSSRRNSASTMSSPLARAPVWFIAHGGPPTLFDVQHAAHQHWLKVLRDIKQAKLQGIVFVSAHWQASAGDFADAALRQLPTSILMNNNESNPLVYDFYNFPKHYYEVNFATKNPRSLQDVVSKHLQDQGFHVEQTDRGLDHGVWVPLRAGGDTFDIPLVQLSLPVERDPLNDGIAALRLGKALRGLRRRGYAVIGGGQPVHNLRDFMAFMQGRAGRADYGRAFSTALTGALTKVGDGQMNEDGDPARWDDAKALFKRPDYLRAHPTSEHLLPALVALGAAEESEAGVEEFAQDEGSMTWNMYRFG